MESTPEIGDPLSVMADGCPDGGGNDGSGLGGTGGTGSSPGGEQSGMVCIEAGTADCPGEPVCEMDCPAEDEPESNICPQPLMGKTLTTLINVAGLNHEFQFGGTMNRVNPSVGRSPAWYYISGPTTSKDSWWIAESGRIQLVCWGAWRFRNTIWIGTVVVQDTDVHMVMGPGHPSF